MSISVPQSKSNPLAGLKKHTLGVSNLRKVYRDFWGRTKAVGLENLTFFAYPGEVIGLIGPNGAGKSTTMKLLLGLLKPTSGNVMILGSNPKELRVKKRIGYLPEELNLYPDLTIEETLHFFASLFGLSLQHIKERTSQLLGMVGMRHIARRRISECSKGMIRRLGLAQALVNDPDVIILDEPTSGLDPLGCRDVKKLITLLAKRHKTVLISSHLLSDIQDICDRIILLYGGKVQAQGTLKSLLTAKDTMQITIKSDATSEYDANALRELLERHLPQASSISIECPILRLEDYFSHIIENARSEKKPTDSVLDGEGIASYLQNESPKTSEEILEEWNNKANRSVL